MRSRPLGGGPAAPHILTRGLITPQEAEKLFDMFVICLLFRGAQEMADTRIFLFFRYFQRMNLSVSLLDPILYTPQKTCYRSPFLFTVGAYYVSSRQSSPVQSANAYLTL